MGLHAIIGSFSWRRALFLHADCFANEHSHPPPLVPERRPTARRHARCAGKSLCRLPHVQPPSCGFWRLARRRRGRRRCPSSRGAHRSSLVAFTTGPSSDVRAPRAERLFPRGWIKVGEIAKDLVIVFLIGRGALHFLNIQIGRLQSQSQLVQRDPCARVEFRVGNPDR
jgi:hypothetical protein